MDKRDDLIWYDRKRTFLGLPWSFTKYSLTEDRLFIESGFLNTNEDEVRLYRIMDVSLKRSLGQRLFGLGTIHCCSADKTMMDYSSGEITTAEAAELIRAIDEEFRTDEIVFYPGISYRHCMIWHEGPVGLDLTPPHDISDRKITEYLPKNPVILDHMRRSYEILKDHPVNQARQQRGLNPANSIWLWGEGTRPAISGFEDTYGMKGSVISAVDLIKGIGICAGMKVIEVEGATGNIDTNFKGKGEAALRTLLEGQDLVYIHVEAPDECGHHGDLEGKIQAIEQIDEQIVGPLLEGLEKAGEDYAILVMPDHPTPIAIKTHVSDPIPYLLYRNTKAAGLGADTYTEKTAKASGIYVEHGYELMKRLLEKV